MAAKLTELESSWRGLSGLIESDFLEFLHTIEFHFGHNDFVELEAELHRILGQVGAPSGALTKLLAAIDQWSVDNSVSRITRDNVVATLGIRHRVPDNQFRIDNSSVVARTKFHSSLAQRISKSPGMYIVVLGMAGAGKSVALNTVKNGTLLRKSFQLIVYNCFIGPGDSDLRTRASAENFVHYFIQEMHRIAPGRWKRRHGDSTQLEAIIKEATQTLSPSQPLVVVIDGLDYAKQNRTTSQASLFDSLPVNLPATVTFVVSAQSKGQLPDHLCSLADAQYVEMPFLDASQTEEVLEKLGVFGVCEIDVPYERRKLAKRIHDHTKGHPLQTQYVIRWLRQSVSGKASVAEIVAHIPTYGRDISDWYSRLPVLQDAYACALVSELAWSPFPLTSFEANSLLSYPKNPYDAENAFSSLSFMLHRSGKEWSFLHDSLRFHVREKLDRPETDSAKRLAFLLGLKDDPRFGEYSLPVSIAADQGEWAFRTIDGDWIADRIVDGSRVDLICKGLRNLLAYSIEQRNWGHAAKWSPQVQRMELVFNEYADSTAMFEFWVQTKLSRLVLRQLIDKQMLIGAPVAALRAAHLLFEADFEAEALQLARLAAVAPLELSDSLLYGETDRILNDHFRHMAPFVSAKDCFDEIRRIVSELAHQQPNMTSLSQKGMISSLAAQAMFASLNGNARAAVSEWRAVAGKYLSRRAIQLANGFVALQSSSIDKTAIKSIEVSLKHNPPLWFIERAFKQDPLKEISVAALQSGRHYNLLLDESNSLYEPADIRHAVQETFDEIRLVAQNSPSQHLEEYHSLVVTPKNQRELIFAVTRDLAISIASEKDWPKISGVLVETVRRYPINKFEGIDRRYQRLFRPTLEFLLEPVTKPVESGVGLPT